MHIVEGLVAVISTSPRTSKTESGFKIYDHFDIAVSASFLGRIIRPEKGPDNPPGKMVRIIRPEKGPDNPPGKMVRIIRPENGPDNPPGKAEFC